MDSEWSTLNARRTTQTGRELDVLRQRYAEHREALGRLADEAPSEHLATEYQKLQELIDESIEKLSAIHRGTPRRTSPGTAPVMPTSPLASKDLILSPSPTGKEQPEESGDGSRILMILAAGLGVLALLGWMAWYFIGKNEDPATPAAVASDAEASQESNVTEEQPPVSRSTLTASPARWDFGAVRKGTRAMHAFEITNTSDATVPMKLSRSTCRCLWFEHPASLAPGGVARLVVTIDGARAKAGALEEIIRIGGPETAGTDLTLTADVQAAKD